ncbi:hypothetical protein BDQ17DRAFT_1089955 [Cyathus striatus]|nr:hypothetical protein BDQ17DRAFT_1089955 [Cyathus striatus]
MQVALSMKPCRRRAFNLPTKPMIYLSATIDHEYNWTSSSLRFLWLDLVWLSTLHLLFLRASRVPPGLSMMLDSALRFHHPPMNLFKVDIDSVLGTDRTCVLILIFCCRLPSSSRTSTEPQTVYRYEKLSKYRSGIGRHPSISFQIRATYTKAI